MCNFLYCCIEETAGDDLFLRISHSHGFVPEGRISPLSMYYDPNIKNGAYFRITKNMCDCGSALGGKDETVAELGDYISWLKELRKCQRHGMKAFYIMKFWEGSDAAGALKPAETVNIEDVDTAFLANIDENRVYRIEYFKRYGSEYTQELV
jgi:hypothetical protein